MKKKGMLYKKEKEGFFCMKKRHEQKTWFFLTCANMRSSHLYIVFTSMVYIAEGWSDQKYIKW